jgi:peptide/nickel transport system substrate-binding protein
LVVGVVSLLLLAALACGAAATAMPPPVQAPAAPAPGAQAAPTAIPKPAPVQAPAPVKVKDTLTIALPNEPGKGDVYMMTTTESSWIAGAMAEPVTIIAKATLDDATLSGFTKWEEKSPGVWRLHLRDGVKFHNGEPWNAEAAKFTFDRYGNKVNGTPNYAFLGDTTTQVIDSKTIEVTCKAGCPIFPRFTGFLHFQAPAWYQQASDRDRLTRVVGYGPMKHVEYRIGEIWKAERYDGYVPVPGLAEGAMPTIKQVTWLFRTETAVRLAMLKTGEADLALRMDLDDADKMPAFVVGAEGSVILLRYDTLWNPPLAKKEIRQALAHAIDCPTMLKALYDGRNECIANISQPGTLGINAQNSKPYEYNPTLAKRLLKEGGYDPANEIRIHAQIGRVYRNGELLEAVIGYWKEIGVTAKLVTWEPAQYADGRSSGCGRFVGQPGYAEKMDCGARNPPAPFNASTHYYAVPTSNESLDYQRQGILRLSCFGVNSRVCDPALEKKIEEASATPLGDLRKQRLEELAQIAYDEYYFITFFHTQVVYGAAKNLEWKPRYDPRIRVNTMRFK